jgi:hypothetical protein
MSRKGQAMTRALAAVTFLTFLLTAFRPGWTRQETDFPGYYTAARMVRQGQPLRDLYDWTAFQRQMNYAGAELQLGGYAAQTPLGMLPFLPLTSLPLQNAKRVWLLFNLVFLGATVWMLSRLTRFRMDEVWLLTFCGYFSLRTNFLYGQYYVFLLFLLTAVCYFLMRGVRAASGSIAGLAFVLKLYSAPLLLLFVAKRNWKAAAGMIAAVGLLGIIALKIFGWTDIHFYLTSVLVRSLDGSPIDPYNPGSATLSNMLHRWLLREPELNPHPFWNAPALSFFLRTFLSLMIAAAAFLGVAAKHGTDRRDFAWFMVTAVLLSSSTGSYTFILLLLPLVLLLEDSRQGQNTVFVFCYVLLTMALHPALLFPRVGLLLAWFAVIGWDYWRSVRPPVLVACAVACAVVAVADMRLRMRGFATEPGQRFERVAVRRGALFSGYPAIDSAGLFYQSMGKDRYVLRWMHDGRDDELSFEGHAFLPVTSARERSVRFELVAHGRSTMMQFETATERLSPTGETASPDNRELAVSPDGKWVAFCPETSGPKQLWVRNVATGNEAILAGGKCNNWSPAWELDSKAVVFASDCGRALGLPALYRAHIEP